MNSNHHWEQDPRLKNISKERLQLLQEMAEQLKQAPHNQKMTKFLSIQKTAAAKGICFQEQERELLISVLTENLTPEEKKKVEMIKRLTNML